MLICPMLLQGLNNAVAVGLLIWDKPKHAACGSQLKRPPGGRCASRATASALSLA